MEASESALSNLRGTCFDQSYLHFRFGIFDLQLFETNIFRGIYQSFDGAFNDMKQIDLSAWNVTEAEKMILLLTCGLITEEDIKSTCYIKKLNVFNKLLQSYGKTHFDVFHPELGTWHYICFSENFPDYTDLQIEFLRYLEIMNIQQNPGLYQLPSEVMRLLTSLPVFQNMK